MVDLDALDRIDWEFDNATTYEYDNIHSFHWFLATFVPQIPGITIPIFTEEEDMILDPFCGTGTVLTEALRLNRKCVGVDHNPLAVLISKVKTTLIDVEVLKNALSRLLKSIESQSSVVRKEGGSITNLGRNAEDLENEIRENISSFPYRRKWFHPETLLELGLVMTNIRKIRNPDIRDFCLVAFSDGLKRCSVHKGRNYGYIADMCIKKAYSQEYVNVLRMFKNKLAKMLRGMEKLQREIDTQTKTLEQLNDLSLVRKGDARRLDFVDDDSVDFVLTSPPYVNAHDYTTGHRLSFYWLGYSEDDIRSLKEDEIGARFKRHRNSSVPEYVNDIGASLSEIRRVLRKNGFLCLIIGQTRKAANGIDVEREVLKTATTDLGFVLEKRISRTFRKQRLGAKSIPGEDICVLRNARRD